MGLYAYFACILLHIFYQLTNYLAGDRIHALAPCCIMKRKLTKKESNRYGGNHAKQKY